MKSQLLNKQGKPVANHFVSVMQDGRKILHSYSSDVAMIGSNGEIMLGPDWNYSQTTIKNVGQFVGMNKRQIDEGIKNGVITVDEIDL